MQLTKWLMNLYKYKRSRSFIGLGPRSLRFNNLLFLSLETAKPIEAKFHLYHPWDGGTKVCSNGPGHMTNMAVMPIYGKNFNNRLLWNQKADGLESWFAALGIRVLPNVFKRWPRVDLDLFYDNVKFGPLCFCMEKR